MTDIVNLNKARKKRDAAARRAEADSNRLKFGERKIVRDALSKSRATDANRLDGHRLSADLDPLPAKS